MTSLILAVTALMVCAVASARWLMRIKQVAIPDNRLPFLLSWELAVVLSLAALIVPAGSWLSTLLAGLALVGAAAMLVLYALGKQRAQQPIATGMTIPSFSAPDEHGVMFRSSSMAGSIQLIKFFRGHW
jgi:hypothetical protein